MFKLHSLAGRVATGTVTGLCLGLLIILLLPAFYMSPLSMFGLGTLLMFILMGIMTGFVGIFDRHPAFDFRLHWWIRGPVIGAMFMLMYILFNYNELNLIMESTLVSWTGLTSPFWALLDGLFYGGLLGFVETTLAGEGTKLPLK